MSSLSPTLTLDDPTWASWDTARLMSMVEAGLTDHIGAPIGSFLRAKRSGFYHGATDAELNALDDCLIFSLQKMSKPSLQDVSQSELFALLPTDYIGGLTQHQDIHSMDFSYGNPLHWLCQTIGGRGLISFKQSDLFAPSQMELLQASLRTCCAMRPDWIHGTDSTGQTPLHWAVYFLALEAIDPLLEAGADPLYPNDQGSPAFDPDFFNLYLKRSDPPANAWSRASHIQHMMERHVLDRSVAHPISEDQTDKRRSGRL